LRLYTKEEIIEDIWQHEGVKIEVSRTMSVTVLYSEVYNRTSDKETVTYAEAKIKEYINEYCSPELDSAPSDDYNCYTIYAFNNCDNKNEIGVKLGSFPINDIEKFKEILDKATDDKKILIVIDYQCRLVKYLKRNMH